MTPKVYTASRWGIYEVERAAQRAPVLKAWSDDPDPSPIGAGRHRLRDAMSRFASRGVRVVNVGPCRDDVEAGAHAEWLPIRPNTDTALMLALAHGVLAEGRTSTRRRCTARATKRPSSRSRAR